MALPALVKTWQHNVNSVQSPGVNNEDCCDKAYLQAKNALIGFALSPWTVVGSSNGVTAGMDGVDRWSTIANLVHGSTRSWIVLKQTGLPGGNFQFCIDFPSSSAYNVTIVLSRTAGFTGGSISARPTATDEHNVWGGSYTLWPGGTFQSVVHAMQSTDGALTRVLFCINNFTIAGWFFETAQNYVTGWTNPVLALISRSTGGGSSRFIMTNYVNNTCDDIFWRHSGSNLSGNTVLGQESAPGGFMSNVFNTIPNAISNEWPMIPMGFSSTNAPTGRHCSLADIYWGSIFHPEATTYPLDGSKQWVHFGHMILPWNGTTPVFS